MGKCWAATCTSPESRGHPHASADFSKRSRKDSGHPVAPFYSGADEWGRLGSFMMAFLSIHPGPSSSGTAHGPPAGPAQECGNAIPSCLTSPAAPYGVLGGGLRAIVSLPQMANLAVTA